MEKLTPREQSILQLLIKGYNNDQIGKIMLISLHTVKVHVSSILRKLNAKNRTNAVYIALKNDLTENN